MFQKVRVSRHALNYFRKLARESYPNEIQAYLIGKIISVDTIEITKFCYPSNYALQSNAEVQWSQEDFTKLQQLVHDNAWTIIGDCHSHPNWDAVMSGEDYRSSIFGGLSICGIVSVYNNKTRVRFWTPSSALSCKVIYT